MVDKEVKVKVSTDVELEKVKALEDTIKDITKQKIKLDIETNTQKLKETEARIEKLNEERATLEVGVDDSKIKEIESELAQLESNKLDLELSIETSKLKAVEAEIESIDETTIDIDANMSIQNISQGISQARQGLSELANSINEVAQAGMQSEQNKAFLEMNLGAEKAKQTYQDISDIVASMPGDDNTMRSVLSTAQALGNDLNPEEMKSATATMADYMAGSATMGKMAKESQQDIMKYLLDGNTAELERGSIVSSHVDKLKDASTFMERQAAMQEVLNELGYGGISQQDTMLNKQAEWEGMIYNSQDALSSMWLDSQKGAMEYILQLNEASNGIVGIGIVAAQTVAGPFAELMGGLSQIGMGFKTLKDAANFAGVTEKLSGLKTALIDAGSAAKNAGMQMLTLAKNALLAGYNALKSAAMWVVQKVQLVASTLATYALSAAQALLNIVMSMNPIMLVVIAIIALIAVLVYLYYNVDSVRQAIDQLGASIIATAQWIYSGFMSIVGIIGSALSSAWNSVTRFCGNLVRGLTNAASNAIHGFVSYIQQLPTIVMNEFNRVLGLVNDFINTLPDRVWDMGTAIIDALKKSLGIGSPGYMFYMLEGELERLDNLPGKMSPSITGSIQDMGSSMVSGFGDTQFNGSSPIGGVSQTFNIEIGSVDSEERIQEIVEVIRRELAWNNTTAGRTV